MAAGRGLQKTSQDIRPSLRAILESACAHDGSEAHDIVRIYEFYLREFDAQASAKK
jgi:hypothetical protein